VPPVLVIPPLLMPSAGMKPLQWRLEANGFDCRLFSYPSYRCTVPENAERLARFTANQPETEFDAVTFSMGGIVLRWAVNHQKMPRLRRVVMIGPPNQGATMADLSDRWLGPGFPILFGRSARQLRTGDGGLCERAGILPAETELGIIAGGTGRATGFNPLIGRDNDRVVAVDETVLEGMKSFTILPIAHGPLLFSRETARLCTGFLQSGGFGKQEITPPLHSGPPMRLSA